MFRCVSRVCVLGVLYVCVVFQCVTRMRVCVCVVFQCAHRPCEEPQWIQPSVSRVGRYEHTRVYHPSLHDKKPYGYFSRAHSRPVSVRCRYYRDPDERGRAACVSDPPP